MARDWDDLFIIDGAAAAGSGDDSAVATERRRGVFRRLRENLRKTRQALTS